jgi:OPT family oligopeptide transporter
MSKAPLLLRSSPGFGTGSYGAAPVPPEEVEDDAGHHRRFAAALSRESTDSTRSRRRRSASTSRSFAFHTSTSSLSRRRKSQSDEIGGSTVAGGLEGRFAVADTALLNDILSDDKSDSSATEAYAASQEDGDTPSEEQDEDPPDNSPYPQVRASVAPTDNITLSINTPRMWILSGLFSILGSSTNLFFSLRYPSVAITPVIALLLVHPLGLMWDYLLKRPDDPPEKFIDGERTSVATSSAESSTSLRGVERNRAQRLRLWLAQGFWNEKEHSCVYVSSNVSFGFAFATDIIVEQTQFYKQDASIIYQLLLTLSTQILGYTFAGLTRRFLVRPSGMIWPGTLMSAAMFTTLHKEQNEPANGWRISRWNFFYVVWICAFLFYFLPGLLMPALSYFNVITWFAPDNVVVANLFGVVSGLGLFPVTFDWAQIAYIGSPLLTPFWASMNVIGGLVIVMWVIAPIGYYCNLFYSSYMPILSASVFDNTGQIYDVGRILTPEFVFDRAAYSKYSRVYLPITYVLSYGLQFAGLASLLTHTACWHGKDIWTQWKRSLKETEDGTKSVYQPLETEDNGMASFPRRSESITASNPNIDDLLNREDVHNRLMRRYKDAPIYWYLLTFVSMMAIGIFVVE